MELIILIALLFILVNVWRYTSKKTPLQKLNVKQTDISAIKLSHEQQQLFEIVKNTNKHIFITGKAGTGKSALLQYIKRHAKKQLVVVAPTGIAAINVGGQTIHSLFKIPPKFIPRNSLRVNSRVASLLRHLDTIIIDEISMVRVDVMDAIDHLLRQARLKDIPFGGVQIIMFGDLYQLPPVVNSSELHKYFRENYGGFYFFNAPAWKQTNMDMYELSHIFRQEDNRFKEILNAIRAGAVNDNLLYELNAKANSTIPGEGVIILAPTNDLVSYINKTKLDKLDGKMYQYIADIAGDIKESEFPTDERLQLKVGAQIMMVKNDKDKRWVNGTIGTIHALNDTTITVNIDGYAYPLSKENWSKIQYYYDRSTRKIEEEVVSTFTQFPIRLAWAITIHKSQGQTYESVVIDMGNGAFSHGQTYVALSRCTNLERLYLKKEIMKEDIIVDNEIISFMNKAKILAAH